MQNHIKSLESNHEKKKVFVFDLHDVLFKRSYWDTFKLCCSIKKKFKLFRILSNPRCIYTALKLLGETRVSEAYLVKLAEKHPSFTEYIEKIIDITNAIKPIPHMFELIKTLKQNGSHVYIFSNIGKKTFEKLNQEYSNLFLQFDGIHYVEEAHDWLAKPHKNAYQLFLSKFTIDPESMVFIDDKNKNVKAAHALGITAFVYTSSCQLLKTLQTKNLIFDPHSA